MIAFHVLGGLPVNDLGNALDISPEIVYIHTINSREELARAIGLEDIEDLPPALNGVAMRAPRLAMWPEIESEFRRRIDAEVGRQRRLSIGVAAGVCAVLVLGVILIAGQGGDASGPHTDSPAVAAPLPPMVGTPYTVLPTPTPTPAANVSDTLVFSSRSSEASRTWLFEQRLDEFPLLGDNTLEAGAPVVAPDGQQVYLLWYEFDNAGATGYVAAFDGDLANELWRVAVAVDDQVEDGERAGFRMSLAADHERVYVARQDWRTSALVEIDVLSRDDGALLETINTNVSGFAVHDIRLHAPPGANQVSLFAITGVAPPETGELQITFLAFEVPGGERIHGRILFDQPDSRTLFLYESQLIVGSEMLFGVEHTLYYHQIAVHLFDLGAGRLEPRQVIPFQPVTDPLPYQQAVSHDGHWLYVLSSAGLEVAVFNLLDQSLAGIVPLDPGVLRGREIGVSYPQGRSMQISPDGSRIYAEGTLDGIASGIWVIDTDSWTIVDHWLPETRPGEILRSGDGRTLYARIPDRSPGASSSSSLVAVDTATGETRPVEMPDADRYLLESIATFFQRTYASSPAIDGRRQESMVSTEPLAGALVNVIQDGAAPGSTVTIDVRFVHPITGEPVDAAAGGPRFQPPDGVRATWTPDSGDSKMILELGRVGYGHYQGVVQLNEPSYWSLRVDIDWPDDSVSDRVLIREREVRIVPAVIADGPPAGDVPSG
ncbi:hypothetical protein BH23CHL2_BH23CHL2_29580 [soil metagenome]